MPPVNSDLRVTDSPSVIVIVETPDVFENVAVGMGTTVIVTLESTENPAPLITLNVYIYVPTGGVII